RIVFDDGRIVMPAAFLSALEDPEVSRAFGLKMLDRVSRDMQSWFRAGLDIKRVAINVSNLELRADDFCEQLISLLQEREISPHLFEIEVTESAAFDNLSAIERNLRTLAGQGISIAIDDFGTGFGSLTHLKSLPITHVKIASPFIGDVVADPKSRSIIDAIVRLSHSIGKSVVVEGIENNAQLAAIRNLKCDVAQGYLFSKPIPFNEVPVFLSGHCAQRSNKLTGHAEDDQR